MKKFWLFIKKLIQGDSKESSKRFLAIYVIQILVTYIVFRYTNSKNYTAVLAQLLAFVGSLVIVSSIQNIQNKKKTEL